VNGKEIALLRACLAAPDALGPREALADFYLETGRPTRSARLRAIETGLRYQAATPAHLAQYWVANYLFGTMGAETGHRPGDPIPAKWPPTPFTSSVADRRRTPWMSFWYCLVLGWDEDAASWINRLAQQEADDAPDDQVADPPPPPPVDDNWYEEEARTPAAQAARAVP
jgi:hypothetical protein